MKKLFAFLCLSLILCGCGRYKDKDIIKDLNKKINNCESYHMTGTLEIYRNEDKYSYDLTSSYKKGDYFKVDLINKNNNHEQIILKNDEGVYVLTPSLNKSFKFQSDWPYNNSQIYLLQPIFKDITNDKDKTIDKTADGYIITSDVDYSTEKDFKKQKVYVDKEKNINKVEIVDDQNNIKMSLKIIDIDYKATFDDDYFSASKYHKEDSDDSNSQKQETAKIEDIVYPMYVPVDTYLSGQDVVSTNDGERVILTFAGESSFTVVQENLNNSDVVNYVYGDPYLILDTVGSVTDSSVSWISNGVEYSILSDAMSVNELLTVAQSIGVEAVSK